MKTRISNIIAVVAMISITAQAQNLESAYFLEGYPFAHQLNPALPYDRSGYVALPILGNTKIGTTGNFGPSDIFFKNPNAPGVVTLMHPDIPIDQALSGIKDHNNTTVQANLQLLAAAFRIKSFHNTIGVRFRSLTKMDMPGELIRMARHLENKDYSISQLEMHTDEWAEIALSTSTHIIPGLDVGGSFKFLLGAAYADVSMHQLNLRLAAPNQWVASADASAQIGVKGFTWGETTPKPTPDNSGTYQEIDFNNMDIHNPGIAGMGAAFDLGTHIDLGTLANIQGLEVSAAVLDLGFIRYSNVATLTNTPYPVVFNGFNNVKVNSGPGTKIDDIADDLSNQITQFSKFQDTGTITSNRPLTATLNVAVRYTLPFYRQLHVGLLSTTRINGYYTSNNQRLAVTVTPLSWLEASVSAAYGTNGASLGFVANIHPKGFNLFIGSDHLFRRLSAQGIPLQSNADFTFGIVFPIGKSARSL